VGVDPPTSQNWYELLVWKLLPQLDAEPLLVVGIVGGTNIGKSLLFNHLAGEIASAVSPLAAGTKHPVCLVPPALEDSAVLEKLFENFQLEPWQSAEDPLRECPESLLFWRVGENVPPRLLLIDAPDVDSDVTVNWDRARAIRQSADVLVAVLTQQKYNDAAVKQFFREAVQADKPVVVVFNQCHFDGDRNYWPRWLTTFCSETGAEPELVYAVPHDREAAERIRLPFYSVGPDGRWPLGEPSSLRDELARLHFDSIKIRTFRGALRRVLDPDHGAPGYLAAIRAAAGEFSTARVTLSASEMARTAWPTLPPDVLVDEIRLWWDAGRSAWSRNIYGFYRKAVSQPMRAAWQYVRRSEDPLESFRRRESEAIVIAVEKLLDELDRLSRVGNDTLRPRLLALLGGHAREDLLRGVRAAHEQLPAVDEDYRRFLRSELDAWRKANPRAIRFLRSLDHVMAIARPAITVTLVVTGWGLAGDLVGHAGHVAGEIAAEAAITGGITGGGEALVSTTTEGVRQAAGQLFSRLQTRYAHHRARWLADWLENELLGDLLADLRRGAEAPQSPEFVAVDTALAELRALPA
jgi:hypothetical protein